MPNFNGSEGTPISKSAAKTLTSRFQTDFPGEKKGYFFGRNHLISMLNQDGCKGIRVYFGKEEGEEGNITLVLAGADSEGDDQSTSSHLILDFGNPCPSDCSKSSEAIG